jgi:hypothetical protein
MAKLNQHEKKLQSHEKRIVAVVEAIKLLIAAPAEEAKEPFGFRKKTKD